MGFFKNLLYNLPEIKGPTQKRLSFKEKLKWTMIILVLFFVLGMVPLFGLGQNALERFELLSVILGANFGSIISLGIGPIVTASIVLQLLNGSGILKFDLTKHEDRKTFQGIQKISAIFFIFFEACIYVFMSGLAPTAIGDPIASGVMTAPLYFQLELVLIFQLFLGGIIILFMDEVVSKWGFGSGVSLFIAAGVSQSVFIRAFSPLPSPNQPNIATGAIPVLFQSLAAGDPQTALLMLAGVASTIVVFVMAVYSQAMKVEIPLSFGRVRGHGIRWPLSFIYTSNIPVILVAALLANIQLWARLFESWNLPIFGTFTQDGAPASGLVEWMASPNIVGKAIQGNLAFVDLGHAGVYTLIMLVGCVIFSWFWVQTSGMDAKSQAKQIMSSGLQIPGFRKDERVLERLLDRYIGPLTIMGAIAVGILAAAADVSGALTSGTGLLLTVMIIYKLYEEIAKQHMMDMNPMLRKFMGGT
jgi:preprotein translocase subunit SecY